MADAIPMRCRAIHSDAATGGNPDSLLPYDQVDSTNAIYSVCNPWSHHNPVGKNFVITSLHHTDRSDVSG